MISVQKYFAPYLNSRMLSTAYGRIKHRRDPWSEIRVPRIGYCSPLYSPARSLASDRRYVVHHNLTANGKTLVERCREAFDFTSFKLESHKGEFLKNNDTGQRKYTHLVAAHVSMITYAITAAVNRVTKLRKEMEKDWVQLQVRKHYRVSSPGGPSFPPDAWENALQYVEDLHHKAHGVGSYLRMKGIGLETDEVESAWWLLRGVSICMAIWPGPYPGVPVQSSAYGNQTPVWIT
ncbi:hypothetical protein F4821DRAFT_917 [Hypoxylon rubiginosum]|uniref:Uncharacterized protein n=1 Tax=Hypoxylon rubiginosum TaxID=110542 RepID=A0ACC0DLN6_9PEZI|nr:hypothetical protein F4821DRAFT_917 [Hypoxylon rubiginosum]